MLSSIYEDALARPDLFHWFGIVETDFDLWLQSLEFRVHPGLVSFWRRTGGGDVFESETLLGPLRPDDSENVLKMNEFHWEKGMPRDLILFNTGCFCSASKVDWPRHRNLLVTLKPGSYAIERKFSTFSDWYLQTLRSEFGGRYELLPSK
ncbi:MAG TPA: hypothetical protein VHZ52_12790 [Acidobacteriaceae bacterium]|jgi:hypothetical protein|nr:hypothetical protein [Acidobacteriaceae bacterium]